MSEKPKEITESLIQAWADFCGIDRSDERAQFPNHPGCWPDDFRLFESGWNAASVIRDFQIAEKEFPSAMLETAAEAVKRSATEDANLLGLDDDDFLSFAKVALIAAGVPNLLADRERIGLVLFQNGYDDGYTTDGAVEAMEFRLTGGDSLCPDGASFVSTMPPSPSGVSKGAVAK